MPRQLPWLVNKGGGQSARHASSSAPPASVSKRGGAATPPNASSATPRQKPSLDLRAGNRSPSTSPPPQPLDEEFMIQGIEHDDKYRMVEDEFLSVAGHFTRHLHAAEYHRLKHRAKTQNAHTIQSISRPVVREKTDAVKRRNNALQRSADQRSGIAQVRRMRVQGGRCGGGRDGDHDTDDEDDEEDPLSCVGTSLQGLMNSPRKKAEPLRVLAPAPSGPRKRLAPDQEGTGGRARRRPTPGLPWARRESSTDGDEDDLERGYLPGPRLSLPSAAKPAQRSSLGRAGAPIAKAAQNPSRARLRSPSPESRRQGAAIASPWPPANAQRTSGEDSEDELLTRVQSRRDRRRRGLSARQQHDGPNIKEDQGSLLNQI